jgi:pimeloyl-ACP methyl ester carboxylesterase
MTTIKVKNRIFYYTRPRRMPGKPGLLLLHGAGGSHLDWPREIQRLPDLDIVNLDLPGHGRTTGGGYRAIDAFAREVDAFATALELKNTAVAGHSLGGAVALTLALWQPEWLSSIVMIGSGARLRVAPQFLQDLQVAPEDAVSSIMTYAWSEAAPSQLSGSTSASMLKTDREVLYDSFLACDQFDMRRRLDEIMVPALVICGSDDRLAPPFLSRELAEGLRDAELHIVADAGHFVTLERPAVVAAAMAAFLGGRSAAS